jgi:hypothetical protein
MACPVCNVSPAAREFLRKWPINGSASGASAPIWQRVQAQSIRPDVAVLFQGWQSRPITRGKQKCGASHRADAAAGTNTTSIVVPPKTKMRHQAEPNPVPQSKRQPHLTALRPLIVYRPLMPVVAG